MKLKLIERKTEVPGVESLLFTPAEPLTWKAGQFLHYVLHHEPTDDRGSDRWFTNSASPTEGHVMITTRFTDEKSSSFKNKLRTLKIGKSIEISYLEGDFVVEDLSKEYVFIAGGIGITPFRSILKEWHDTNKKGKVTLLYANRDEHIVFKEELDSFAARNPMVNINYLISPQHIDATTITAAVPDITSPYFYVSGPEPMVENLGAMLRSLGVADDHLKQDWFPGYPLE